MGPGAMSHADFAQRVGGNEAQCRWAVAKIASWSVCACCIPATRLAGWASQHDGMASRPGQLGQPGEALAALLPLKVIMPEDQPGPARQAAECLFQSGIVARIAD
jgi:hypothetical protein